MFKPTSAIVFLVVLVIGVISVVSVSLTHSMITGNAIRIGQVQISPLRIPCLETDGGLKPYVAGRTIGDFGTMGVRTNKDRCAGDTLREYYCDTFTHQQRIDLDCSEGCLENAQGYGACVCSAGFDTSGNCLSDPSGFSEELGDNNN